MGPWPARRTPASTPRNVDQVHVVELSHARLRRVGVRPLFDRHHPSLEIILLAGRIQTRKSGLGDPPLAIQGRHRLPAVEEMRLLRRDLHSAVAVLG